jgi:hypothetical protein
VFVFAAVGHHRDSASQCCGDADGTTNPATGLRPSLPPQVIGLVNGTSSAYRFSIELALRAGTIE